jgi:hypothetical protein
MEVAMYVRKIVCLANSRKPPSGGRCIAGKEIEGPRAGQWIRPVSDRADNAITEEERRYENGQRSQLLDIVTIPLEAHLPIGHQRENHVIADEYWSKEGVASWNLVTTLIDPYDASFWMQVNSTQHGLNDKIPEGLANTMLSSLKLIEPENFAIHVEMDPGFDGGRPRKRVRAQFDYHGQTYKLVVTDPFVEEQYLALAPDKYHVDTAILCISHAEVWANNSYASRLVASVITPDLFED